MSFLNSVLSSIGTGEANLQPLPKKTESVPTSGNINAKAKSDNVKVPTPSTERKTLLSNEQKRKADSEPCQLPDKLVKSSSGMNPARPADPVSTSAKISQHPAHHSTHSGKSPAPSGTSKVSSKPGVVANAPPKAPAKGSYAELIARAKQAQAERGLQVGVIKHQNVAKEKKLSKLERKKQEEEAKKKEREEKSKKTFGRVSNDPRSSGKIVKPGAAIKDRPAPESGYKGTARPPPSTASYKGTSGMASRRPPPKATDRRRRGNEYLGTDEEDSDEDDELDDDEDEEGGYSDASSDMEAGVFDVDEEEREALKTAKREDEEELRLESQLKREKEERRRRMEALVAKAKKK